MWRKEWPKCLAIPIFLLLTNTPKYRKRSASILSPASGGGGMLAFVCVGWMNRLRDWQHDRLTKSNYYEEKNSYYPRQASPSLGKRSILKWTNPRAWGNAQSWNEQIPKLGETLNLEMNKSPSLGKHSILKGANPQAWGNTQSWNEQIPKLGEEIKIFF